MNVPDGYERYSTTYEVIDKPPVFAGVAHVKLYEVDEVSVALKLAGAPGVVAGTAEADAEATPVPAPFVAVTVKV